MKSRTSFFNVTLFKKDLTRFAPAWVLYGIFLVLVVGSSIFGDTGYYLANNLPDMTAFFSILNLCYAFLVAQLLFGDLFQSRMCNALHALPIRREGWFLTHLAAGMAFSLVPNAVFSLLLMSMLEQYWAAALLWLAVSALQYLFFFAVAAFSAMLVGNRFAMLVIYGILNFLSCILLWLVQELYMPHLYGVEMDLEPFLLFCPVVWFANFEWFDIAKHAPFLWIEDGWGYLGICTAVALGLLGGALVLYRKRPLEKAADFMVFPKVAPVFLVVYTFCAGAALHLVCSLFWGEENILFLVVGLAIGFFTGRMLLDRTIRVFRWKSVAKFAALVAVFGLTVLATIWDPLGITRWVPEEQQVKAVRFYSDNQYLGSTGADYTLTDPQLIRDIISIQQYAVDHPEMSENGLADLQMVFQWTMADGRQKVRRLYVDMETLAGQSTLRILSRPESVFGVDHATADALAAKLSSARFNIKEYELEDSVVYDPALLKGLAEALIQDCHLGVMAQVHNIYSTNDHWAWMYLEGKTTTLPSGIVTHTSWDIFITPECVNTHAWLKANGYE